MSDIHVLEGSFKPNGSGSYRIAYHIPVTEAKYPADATIESAVQDISGAELAALRDGTGYEHVESVDFNVAADQAAVAASVRARWHEVKTLIDAKLANEYKFYLTTLARS